ncbi:MAG: hypothetical protein WC998_04570 [Candidatus Paceibacterota bacterium]|jgi:hypothetical protein
MEHDEMVTKIITLEGSMKTIYNRVDDIDDKLDTIENKQDIMHEMNTNIKIIALNQENQNKEIVTIKTDVKELKEKPGKRWDTLTTVIITALITGTITFALSKIFGG